MYTPIFAYILPCVHNTYTQYRNFSDLLYALAPEASLISEQACRNPVQININNFLHSSVTSSLLGPNTLLNTLFSNTLSGITVLVKLLCTVRRLSHTVVYYLRVQKSLLPITEISSVSILVGYVHIFHIPSIFSLFVCRNTKNAVRDGVSSVHGS